MLSGALKIGICIFRLKRFFKGVWSGMVTFSLNLLAAVRGICRGVGKVRLVLLLENILACYGHI